MNESILAEKLKALGDPLRLKILQILPDAANCEHGNNVSQLAEKFGCPQPTISHHLKILKQAGLIANKKMCRDVFYWVDREALSPILQYLEPLAKDRALK